MNNDITLKISKLRKDYKLEKLDEESVNKDPYKQFDVWFTEAVNSKLIEPNALSLSTIENNKPTSRIVLMKEFSKDGFTFFTNYTSQKGRNLEKNANVALLFYWADLERQVRIEGSVSKLNRKDSERYFSGRPRTAQIGAWASNQSEVIETRAVLEKRFTELNEQFKDKPVSCPEHWGGYVVTPVKFEFWQGRENRLHDRIQYLLANPDWSISRLSP